MKKFFFIAIAVIAALSFSSCSMMNEPNEDDYVKMASKYDVEEIGIVGTWSSMNDELVFEFKNENVDGYNTGIKRVPSHENPINIYWQVVKYEHPSEYSYGKDLTHTGGYLRILGMNYVGSTWLFEMMEDGTMRLVSPQGKEHICQRVK